MKIYVATSWRNEFQHMVVNMLRSDGHQVYDFRETGDGWGGSEKLGPSGFSWSETGDPNWKDWVHDIPSYLKALNHPRAEEGFWRDMNALMQSDACVMVHPCGVSAAMETGWACGAKKRVCVYVPGLREPDLMVKMADLITDDFSLIRAVLLTPEAAHAK